MSDTSVNIRNIQHFMYCPRRYSLLELNDDWSENYFVIKANLLHEHVHDGTHDFSSSEKLVRSNMTVYNDLPEYDLFGVVDCVEFVRDNSGIKIEGADGTFRVRIIEYKPKAPKGGGFNETDAIQVFAQKICADSIWGCDSEAYLYYSDIRKRIKLPFDTEYQKYDELLKNILCEIRKIREEKAIVPRAKSQKCSGCSMSDVCFPKVKKYNVKDTVMSQKGECGE